MGNSIPLPGSVTPAGIRAREKWGQTMECANCVKFDQMRLGASLVTLSACDQTGVGPVGAAGVNNLVTAFIDGGARSVGIQHI